MTRSGESGISPVAIAVAAAFALTLKVSLAAAAPRLFEPTDLELEEAGTFDIDLQFGAIRDGDGAMQRLVLPDFEIEWGLLPNVEVQIDGAFTLNRVGRSFREPGAENLWTSVKLGVLDTRNAIGKQAFALGFQLGPRLPVAPGSRGIGYEGLILLGYSLAPVHTVLNLGAIFEPQDTATQQRRSCAEAGFDVSVDLTRSGEWGLINELGGARCYRDIDDLHVTTGVVWGASKSLDVSFVALYGLLSEGDRFGALIGFSPKISLW